MNASKDLLRGGLFLFVMAGWAMRPAWSQQPDLGPVQSVFEDFVNGYSGGAKNVERLLSEQREINGPCADVLSSIHSRNQDLKPAFDTLAGEVAQLLKEVQPIMDIKQEVQKQKQELEKLQQQAQSLTQESKKSEASIAEQGRTLDEIRKAQRQAIGQWLVDNYGQTASKLHTIDTGKEIVVICNTLFGTMVIKAPPKLKSPENGQISVQLLPALFADDLFPENVRVGPVGTTVDPPKTLEFKPGKVIDGHGGRNFQMVESDQVRVDGVTPIIWHWTANANSVFREAHFGIEMGARVEPLPTYSKGSKSVVLPVDIAYDPGNTLWQSYASIITPILTFIFGIFLMWITKKKERVDRKQEREEEEQRKRAERAHQEAEAKRKEEERNRPRIIRPDE